MSEHQETRDYVFSFGEGEGTGETPDRNLLGGKGAGLAEMSRLGIPVPPGFTLSTEACIYFQRHDGQYPPGLQERVAEELRRLEEKTGRRFGDPDDPLLLSVRSGAVFSMPGMMDTILNLGLNRETVVAASRNGYDPRFLRDCYRRLLAMYGDVVLGVPHRELERVLTQRRREQRVASDAELSVENFDRVIDSFEALCAEHGTPFPQDPHDQLWGAITAVFKSWDNRRAREYRRLHHISDDLGTAVNVQVMVFGNRGPQCATGVGFTRDPGSGERRFYGEYLVNAQGEDVVAGTRDPLPVEGKEDHGGLAQDFPRAWQQLQEVSAKLEAHFRDMQDLEFTIEDDILYLLQTRTGKRTGPAAVSIAAGMVEEGLITPQEALQRVQPEQLAQMLAPGFDPKQKEQAVAADRLLARGLPAGPGAASGKIALTAERAAEMAAAGPVLLVREETSPEDIVGMHASQGILTARGGMTSHAAVVARGLGKPCIVGAAALEIDEHAGVIRVKGRALKEGDLLSMDGTAGEVLEGELATRASPVLRYLLEGEEPPELEQAAAFVELLGWADEERTLKVRANADTPDDARVARAFGAQGIGLCRTEHMFFAEDRIAWVRQMILSPSGDKRQEALDHLLPVQQEDFEGIFQAMAGLPVTVRLLDPPLHEFLPREPKAVERLARRMGLEPAAVTAKVAALAEVNPMLGHRGCRLGLTAPEIYSMQVEAIVRAACARTKAGDEVLPEIMLPLVGSEEEIAELRRATQEVVDRVLAETGVPVEILIGTMIEVPRACLVADKIARHTDFFSFGTNDLTQMAYGFSRDDVGRFLPQYLEQGILAHDPFERLDEAGVGELVATACRRGRRERPTLKIGICGEHGGEPHSVAFFHRAHLDYVSCSPYRVPVARLAAAQAAMETAAVDATV
jgi:pyruvate, orthophosphate dikinase